MDADSAYTERYMGLPNVTDNYKGYEEAELIKVADQLRDKQYLLVGMEGSWHSMIATKTTTLTHPLIALLAGPWHR